MDSEARMDQGGLLVPDEVEVGTGEDGGRLPGREGRSDVNPNASAEAEAGVGGRWRWACGGGGGGGGGCRKRRRFAVTDRRYTRLCYRGPGGVYADGNEQRLVIFIRHTHLPCTYVNAEV